MMLVLPVIWQRYFVWLLPVFAYILSRRPSRAVTPTLGGIFALIAVLSLYSPILTLLTVVPLWVVAGWTFTHSSQRARREGGKVLAAIRQRIRGARRGARVGARADRASELATPPPRFIPE